MCLQRAPYEAVVGNTRLADLKKQLRLQAAHAQQLTDAAAGSKRVAQDDGKVGPVVVMLVQFW
jgi:hypothetical protein